MKEFWYVKSMVNDDVWCDMANGSGRYGFQPKSTTHNPTPFNRERAYDVAGHHNGVVVHVKVKMVPKKKLELVGWVNRYSTKFNALVPIHPTKEDALKYKDEHDYLDTCGVYKLA